LPNPCAVSALATFGASPPLASSRYTFVGEAIGQSNVLPVKR
jgi:hypothetical protein